MKRLPVLLVIVCWLSFGGEVRAEQPDKKTARLMMALGQHHFGAKRYVEAINAFKKAYAAWPRHEIQFNIAYAYARLNDKIQAVTHLRKFLPHATPAQKAALPPILKYMLTHSGFLSVQAPSGAVSIYVDGRLAGKGRIDVVVEPGKRTVEVRWDDGISARRVLEVFPGADRVWKLTEKPRPRVQPRPRPRPQPKPPARRALLHWGYLVAVCSVAAAVGGAALGTGLKTLALKREFDRDPSWPLLHEGNRWRNATNVLLAIAGGTVVAAGLVAIFTRWRKPERPKAVSIRPGPGPGDLGLSLRVDWK